MADTLLTLAGVMRMVGMKKTATYARIAAGTFPAPIKDGGASRWVEAEVQAWIEARKAERSGDRNGDRRLVA